MLPYALESHLGIIKMKTFLQHRIMMRMFLFKYNVSLRLCAQIFIKTSLIKQGK